MSKPFFVKPKVPPRPASRLLVSSHIVPQSFPRETNILLLGETGVRKSTFINSFLNYLMYDTMDEAMKFEPRVLIENNFTISDRDGESHKIVVQSTEGTGRNESMLTGASGTQDPKAYVFEHASGRITLIDTPGIGDVRGIEQDEINFDKVLSFIAQYDDIHAICILMPPNLSRTTVAFRFCLDELLHHLHKSASQNIMFCFTNGRGTSYRPGESLASLKAHLKTLSETRQIDILTNKETLFCFENEAFRFMCAHRQNQSILEPEDRTNSASSWTRTVTEMKRMLERMTALGPHKTRETLSVNNTRNHIIRMSQPLNHINKTLTINIEQMKRKQEEIDELYRTGSSLKGKLYFEKLVLNKVDLEQPQTVCANEKCVTYKRLGNDDSKLAETVYSTICHRNCKRQGVEVQILNNPRLQRCAALRHNIESCKKCGCGWQLHMHIRYEIRESLEKIIDVEMHNKISSTEDRASSVGLFMAELEAEIAKKKQDQQVIIASVSEFAIYLSQNSMIPYNDAHAEYMEYLIREQAAKPAEFRDPQLVDRLREMQKDYKLRVDMLKKALLSGTGKAKSLDEIDAIITRLYGIDDVGKLIRSTEKSELSMMQQTRNNLSVVTKMVSNRLNIR